MASPGIHAATRRTLKTSGVRSSATGATSWSTSAASYHRQSSLVPGALHARRAESVRPRDQLRRRLGGRADRDDAAARRGLEAIVVGVPNMGAERLDEYSPWHDQDRGRAARATRTPTSWRALSSQLIDGVSAPGRRGTPPSSRARRWADSSASTLCFGTRTSSASSGALSPSLWFAGGAIFAEVERAPRRPGADLSRHRHA